MIDDTVNMILKRAREETVDDDEMVGMMLNGVTLKRKTYCGYKDFVYELNVEGNTAVF